jgi:hypothetical protein
MDAHKMRTERSVDPYFSRKKARQFSSFLRALKDAQEYAQDLQCSRWEFAISLAELGATDVQIHDLRWMIRKGWIHHNGEATLEPDCRTNVRPDERSKIHPGSCFIIGQSGIDALTNCSDADGSIGADSRVADLPTVIKPCWDAERHELSFVGQIVKRFRWPASNQETILMAFEEEAWPSRIDDPLPPVNDVDPKRRLSDSIKCLNRNQRADLVRFRGDGTGQGIFWDARPNR